MFALGAGVDLTEAGEYLEAYAALLEAPERNQRYRPDFDPIIMCDSVLLSGTGDVVMAPTNPLTMAFYATFAAAAGKLDLEWAATEPGRRGGHRARHLLPMFNHDDRWYESLPGNRSAWRRYQPMFTPAPQPITTRL